MRVRISALLIAVLFYALTTAAAPPSILHHTKNSYGSKWVSDQGGIRCLSFKKPSEGIFQSCTNLNNPNPMLFDYTKMMLAGLYINPNPQKILFIGLGGATVPKAIINLLPTTQIDVVEIDPEVIEIAEKYFSFKPTSNVKIFNQDGIDFVHETKAETYDMIFVDTFDENYIPPAFLTNEFTNDLKKILTKTGVASINTFSKSKTYQLESELYLKTFGAIINLLSTGNRIIIVSNDQFPSHARIVQQAEKWQNSFKQFGIWQNQLLEKFGLGYMKIVLPIDHGFAT